MLKRVEYFTKYEIWTDILKYKNTVSPVLGFDIQHRPILYNPFKFPVDL